MFHKSVRKIFVLINLTTQVQRMKMGYISISEKLSSQC